MLIIMCLVEANQSIHVLKSSTDATWLMEKFNLIGKLKEQGITDNDGMNSFSVTVY